jgi:chromosome segregation ATPase
LEALGQKVDRQDEQVKAAVFASGARLEDLGRTLEGVGQKVDRQDQEVTVAVSSIGARLEDLVRTLEALGQKVDRQDEEAKGAAAAIEQLKASFGKLSTTTAAMQSSISGLAAALGDTSRPIEENRQALGELGRQITAIRDALLELAKSGLISMNLGHEQIAILRRLDAANLLPDSTR